MQSGARVATTSLCMECHYSGSPAVWLSIIASVSTLVDGKVLASFLGFKSTQFIMYNFVIPEKKGIFVRVTFHRIGQTTLSRLMNAVGISS